MYTRHEFSYGLMAAGLLLQLVGFLLPHGDGVLTIYTAGLAFEVIATLLAFDDVSYCACVHCVGMLVVTTAFCLPMPFWAHIAHICAFFISLLCWVAHGRRDVNHHRLHKPHDIQPPPYQCHI